MLILFYSESVRKYIRGRESKDKVWDEKITEIVCCLGPVYKYWSLIHAQVSLRYDPRQTTCSTERTRSLFQKGCMKLLVFFFFGFFVFISSISSK